ncbi:hypothetical protein DES53_11513 [Roseimicrobium gellanilyticum]|uniref:Polyketide cyclase/dehydrase/lipid transport protein n=1 Tax=Roseimicrobium gellanilyticum TaxID=748857 RepID=A0A366H5E4_9BACT|nr:hypothetical protein DES53_11513 [Roseimicrobium gellanilyticum]
MRNIVVETTLLCPAPFAFRELAQWEEWPFLVPGFFSETPEQTSDKTLHVSTIVTGRKRTFHAKLVSVEWDKGASWISADGLFASGEVFTEALPHGGTHFILILHYQPQGLTEICHDLLGLVHRRMRDSVVRLKGQLDHQWSMMMAAPGGHATA